jgi:hypothetical protein
MGCIAPKLATLAKMGADKIGSSFSNTFANERRKKALKVKRAFVGN